MKILVSCLLGLVFLLTCALAQQTKQVPKGIREADKASQRSESSIPPPQNSFRRNPQQLQQDAAELAKLADSIPPQVEQVRRGLLPRDLNERLKKIEKLSKRLRNELAP